MPPKKGGDKGKGGKENTKDSQDDNGTAQQLQDALVARTELELGNAVTVDSLRQARAENERLLAELATARVRIANATQDYVDILQHREEQHHIAEERAGSLAATVERLQSELAVLNTELARMREVNEGQAEQLQDAAALLQDKERLEDTVRRQHELIEQRAQEAKVARATLDARDAALDKARAREEELALCCQGSTQLRVLFGELFLVTSSRVRLRGALPHDREYSTIAATAGGKQLLLVGGQLRSQEQGARQTAVLSLDTLTWEQPESMALPAGGLMGHSTTPVGRNKLLAFGGASSGMWDTASDTVTVLSTDTMRWAPVTPSGAATPQPRVCHAAAMVRDKVYIFGGVAQNGTLLNDLWCLDTDTSQWSRANTYGTVPVPRRCASLCVTEDARRLYLFGGRGACGLMNDVVWLDLDRMLWSTASPLGVLPEPREGALAAIVGGRYMLVAGGAGTAAAHSTAHAATGAVAANASGAQEGNGVRRLADVHVLDMFTGPAWEQLDAGTWAANLPWLKQMSAVCAVHGSRLYTLVANLREQLDEMLIIELTLPQDIERMQAAHARAAEQVDALELCQEAVATPSTLELTWRPPTKNAERVQEFKLLMSASSAAVGTAREVFRGRGLGTCITGLRPAQQYVFCVKATYDDGSHIWSEPRAFLTRT